jgi:DNA gyrase/topoisomerase IV subunit B
LKENEENLSGDDVREGLTGVLSIKVPEPQFEGQTKTKLGNSEVRPLVDSLVSDQLQENSLKRILPEAREDRGKSHHQRPGPGCGQKSQRTGTP